MMNIVYLVHLISDNLQYLAIALVVLGVAVLVKSAFTQDEMIRHQKQVNAQLRAHVADCLKAQIASFDQVDQLQERCAKLLARQQLVEKRGPDARRIELATRMLKRGSADIETLHDLGLTNSEIKLLTRLHRSPEAGSRSESSVETGSEAETSGIDDRVPGADSSKTVALPPNKAVQKPVHKPAQEFTREEASRPAQAAAPVSVQGQALAQLFETQAAHARPRTAKA